MTETSQATSPSDLVRSSSDSLEVVANEITTPQMFRLMADIIERLKNGCDNPSAVRLEIGQNELRIKHNTEIIVKASKPNGIEIWNVTADHYVHREFNQKHVKFHY